MTRIVHLQRKVKKFTTAEKVVGFYTRSELDLVLNEVKLKFKSSVWEAAPHKLQENIGGSGRVGFFTYLIPQAEVPYSGTE